MKPARVLVVDDSSVVRRILGELLASDPEIELAGSAANGRQALEAAAIVKPDVVTLDVEMPEMDGLAALREMRRLHPNVAVIMVSTLTQRGAQLTLDALANGAVDFVAKPVAGAKPLETLQRVRDELVQKVKLHARARARVATPRTSASTGTSNPSSAPQSLASGASLPRVTGTRASGPLTLVAIGVSTGGPNALNVVVPALPAEFPLPILVVQHMPPIFTRSLADQLQSRSRVRVTEAVDLERLEPGHVYVAPGDRHMQVERIGESLRISLDQRPPEHSCRPAVDPLFRSVARASDGRALGVVLTGMGRDGVLGAAQLRRAGGVVVAQDEATSVVWGMPGLVVKEGLADAVLPIERIADEIVRRAPVATNSPFARTPP